MTKRSVEIVESCVVRPSVETPNHNIWLSNLDLIWSGEHTPVLVLYRHNGEADFFDFEMLKSAMAKTLCTFYHLAGRLSVNEGGQHEIQCTGEGVYYVVARCNSTLADFGEFTPSKELRQLFVPSLRGGEKPAGILLMVQVTYFKCGGVCLGIWTDHRAVDGQCMLQFYSAWARNTRGMEDKVTLYLDRTILRARSPPMVTCEHYECGHEQASRTLSVSKTRADVAMLKLSKDQISALKDRCRDVTKDGYPSTFVAVSSYVWRCTCKARQLREHEETRLYVAADARTRLNPHLPLGFFGNAIVRTSTEVTVGDILSDPLHVIADKIRGTTARVDDEYIRSVIDCLELNGIYGCAVNGSFARSANDLLAVSWMRLSLTELDFGWGCPMFKRRAELASAGQVYFLSNNEGGMTVIAALEPENMPRFKSFFYEDLAAM